jgi:hypothetical protein
MEMKHDLIMIINCSVQAKCSEFVSLMIMIFDIGRFAGSFSEYFLADFFLVPSNLQ